MATQFSPSPRGRGSTRAQRERSEGVRAAHPLRPHPPIAAQWAPPSPAEGRGAVIGLIVGVIIAILLIGLVLKLLKVAIIVAIAVGIVMLAQKHFGRKRIR